MIQTFLIQFMSIWIIINIVVLKNQKTLKFIDSLIFIVKIIQIGKNDKIFMKNLIFMVLFLYNLNKIDKIKDWGVIYEKFKARINFFTYFYIEY